MCIARAFLFYVASKNVWGLFTRSLEPRRLFDFLLLEELRLPILILELTLKLKWHVNSVKNAVKLLVLQEAHDNIHHCLSCTSGSQQPFEAD